MSLGESTCHLQGNNFLVIKYIYIPLNVKIHELRNDVPHRQIECLIWNVLYMFQTS